MNHYSIIFFVAALLTGLLGFTGLGFDGIEIVRVLCLIFTDLLVVSLVAKAFFPEHRLLRFQKVKK